MTTNTEIQVNRIVVGGSLHGMTYEVDGMLVASLTSGRMRGRVNQPWTVRLYFGPDEYDLWQIGNLTRAMEVARDHAEAF